MNDVSKNEKKNFFFRFLEKITKTNCNTFVTQKYHTPSPDATDINTIYLNEILKLILTKYGMIRLQAFICRQQNENET